MRAAALPVLTEQPGPRSVAVRSAPSARGAHADHWWQHAVKDHSLEWPLGRLQLPLCENRPGTEIQPIRSARCRLPKQARSRVFNWSKASRLVAARSDGPARLGLALVLATGALAVFSDSDWRGSGSSLSLSSSSPSAEAVRTDVPSAVGGRAQVRDGDTIEVDRVAVRLQGLHCPEPGEPGGRDASLAMQLLNRGNEVACKLTGERTYDRIVGTCRVGNTDLAAPLIREGVCARCPRYDPAGRYTAVQREAGAWNRSMPGYCR